MFIHERNNMNKVFNTLCLSIALLGVLNISNSLASQNVTIVPSVTILSTAQAWLTTGNNGKIAAISFLVAYLSHQYYKHKTRPQDEDISAEGYKRRKYEILHGDHSLYTKIKLLISFIDDFYVFGRRGKSVEKEITTFAEDGTETMVKDKKTIIKGTGPVTFLYDNIFDGLETILKSIGTVGTLVLLVDRLLAGQLDYLIQPTTAKCPTK